MPTSTMFTPVDTFLFAFCVRFWAAAPTEGYFRVEFVAEPDFSCFGALGGRGFLSFLLVILHPVCRSSPMVRACLRASTCSTMLS